jgi:hypothetical protein
MKRSKSTSSKQKSHKSHKSSKSSNKKDGIFMTFVKAAAGSTVGWMGILIIGFIWVSIFGAIAVLLYRTKNKAGIIAAIIFGIVALLPVAPFKILNTLLTIIIGS